MSKFNVFVENDVMVDRPEEHKGSGLIVDGLEHSPHDNIFSIAGSGAPLVVLDQPEPAPIMME